MQQFPSTVCRLTATLAALWLTACGGGGAGDPGLPGAAPLAATAVQADAGLPMAASTFSWTTAYSSPRIWHSLSASTTADVVAAGQAGGPILVSSDGGLTWTPGDSPSGIWISSAMSATGDRIFAVQYGVGMYTSTDRGRSWRQLTSSPLIYDPAGIAFEAVSVSQDGRELAVVIQNGRIVLSHDGGATWSAATLPDEPQNRWWRWIDSSADGRVLAAVSHNGEFYLSIDTGATWKAVAVGAPGAPVAEHWYRVKVSADGKTLAVVANSFGGAPGTGIYVSRDTGRSWSKGFSLVADYTFLGMSADGQSIAATVSNTGGTPGRVLLSTDAGASFAPLVPPGTDTNWRALAMSASGDRLAVAAGGFNTQSAGLLYLGRASGAPAPSPAPTPAPSPAPTPAPTPTPAPPPAPSCSPAAWNGTTRYMPGDTVMRNGIMYRAVQPATAWNVNSPPEWTPSYWAVTSCSAPAPSPAPTPAPSPAPSPAPTPAPSPAPTPAPSPSCSAPTWNGTTRYMAGDRVLRNGVLYTATALSSSVWNVNSPPEWTPSYWSVTACP